MKKNHSKLIVLLFVCFANIQQIKSAVYYLKAGGNITTVGHWATGTNGISGTILTSFSLASTTYDLTNNNTALTLSSNWAIAGSNAVINVGDATNAFTLTLATGASITTTVQINIRNNATWIDDVGFGYNVSKTNPNAGSTMVFGANATQMIAFNTAYHHVIINRSNVTLNAPNITINGLLTINSGNALTLNNLNLNVKGGLAGAGEFIGDNNGGSGLNISTATGNFGTLRMQSGSESLSNLTINLGSASSSVTLGSALIIDGGTANFTQGMLALNGNSLQVATAGAIDFSGGGTIFGTSTSAIEIDGAITGSLMMDATGNNLGGLIINSNGNTITAGNTLNIQDSILVIDGTLDANSNITLKASATRMAKVSTIGATGAVSGNLTVESFFPAGLTGWALIGVNGVTGQSVSNLDGQIPMTCNGCIYGQNGLGSWFNSIQAWNESVCDFDTSITSATSMSPGKGFWVYLGNSSPSGTTPGLTWSFTGPLKQGSFTIPITANFSCGTSTVAGAVDGQNLVANPYACPISWEKLYNAGGNAGNLNTSSVYYWNRTNVSAADYNASSHIGTGGGTDIIPAGEGFFVENAFGSTLDFNETVKTNLHTVSMFKSASSNKLNLLRLRVRGIYDTDDAVFTLIPNATTGFDKYDTHKKFSTPGYGGSTNGGYSHYTSISSLDVASGRYFSINGFPPTSYSMSIPVLVRVSTTGSYTITADEFENYGSCAVLKDRLNNTYHDLKVSPYVFFMNDTTNTPRFELIVCESGGGVVSVKDLFSSTNISIAQTNGIPVVKTTFPQNTDVVISVYNILGQQLINDIKVSGSETNTPIPNLNLQGQVVLVKVTAGNQSVTKKLILD